MAAFFSRRAFLRAAAATSGVLLAACQPKIVEVEKVVTSVVEKVVKETVVVEGESKVVEKIVKETVVVEAKPAGADAVTIRFHEGINPGDTGRAEQLFAAFTEENPGIVIKHEPLPDGWPDKVLTMMAAGTAPDIQLGYGDPMYAFVSRGMFTDLQPFIDRDLSQADVDDFVKPQWDFFEFGQGGKKFAMPKYCGTSAFLYNKALFDQFGISYPDNTWDWTKGLEIGEAFTKYADDGRYETMGWDIADIHSLGYVLAWMIWEWGGEVHDPNDNAICQMASPEALEALQFAQDLRWKYKVLGTPSDFDAMKTIGWGLIATGKVAFHRGGSWHIPMALNSCDFPFDCMENPYAPGTKTRSTFLTTDGWGIWKGSEHQEEAWTFLNMLSASGIWTEFLIKSSWPLQPAKKSYSSVWVDHLKGTYPRMANADIDVFNRCFEYARPQVSFCDNPGALEIINPVLEQIYKLGTVQAKEAIPPMVDKVNEFLAKACPEGGWAD